MLEPILRLTRDERKAAETLGQREARYLVDTYYQIQRGRITANNQLRASEEAAEPNSVLNWIADQNDTLEKQLAGALRRYSESHPVGEWAMSVKGIGPVISAGLISRLGPEIPETVGHWWRFCGLDPTVKWEKGKRRPWNAALKRLCFLIGESFTKVSGYEDAFYGKVYRERKEYETAKNEAGDYADQAAAALERHNYRAETQARAHYEKGHLPPAQINRRAQRYATKFFLSHFHFVWYTVENGKLPPMPYAIAHQDHAHMIYPPDFSYEKWIEPQRR